MRQAKGLLVLPLEMHAIPPPGSKRRGCLLLAAPIACMLAANIPLCFLNEARPVPTELHA